MDSSKMFNGKLLSGNLEKLKALQLNSSIQSIPTPLIVVLVVVIVATVSYFAMRHYKLKKDWNQYVNCGRCYSRFENKAASIEGLKPVPSHKLPAPNSGNNCTYSMWLYIADWGTNFGKWKSVFCKSPTFPTCNSIRWDMVPNQSPGIWLADKVNNLRIVVQTNVAVPKRCLQYQKQADQPADSTKSSPASGANISLADCMKEPQAANTIDVPILEFIEMKNVPIGKWFQFTFVLRDTFVELYRDGELFSTTPLIGRPLLNVNGGRFAPANPFSGRMSNFRYMPVALLLPMIRRLYKRESKLSFLDIIDPMEETT